MKFIIVDDNAIFRDGLTHYMEDVLSHEIIKSFSNGEEFLEDNNGIDAQIVLMDIEMPGMNGIETAKKAIWQFPNQKIIAITSYTEKAYLYDLVVVGFKGCVFKSNIYEEIEEAIKTVISNKLYFPPDLHF